MSRRDFTKVSCKKQRPGVKFLSENDSWKPTFILETDKNLKEKKENVEV